MEINKSVQVDEQVVDKTVSKKKQIILAHTGCNLEDYLVKITTRYNKKYDRVPAYVIAQDGTVYEFFNPKYSTKFMEEDSVDKMSIIIVLENVGWLAKDPKENTYCDWKGHEYLGDVAHKDWRNKKHWATYSDEQMVALLEVIPELCQRFKITKAFVGDNIPIHKPKTFKGVITRSNYDKKFYDLSPAFNFDLLNENLN